MDRRTVSQSLFRFCPQQSFSSTGIQTTEFKSQNGLHQEQINERQSNSPKIKKIISSNQLKRYSIMGPVSEPKVEPNALKEIFSDVDIKYRSVTNHIKNKRLQNSIEFNQPNSNNQLSNYQSEDKGFSQNHKKQTSDSQQEVFVLNKQKGQTDLLMNRHIKQMRMTSSRYFTQCQTLRSQNNKKMKQHSQQPQISRLVQEEVRKSKTIEKLLNDINNTVTTKNSLIDNHPELMNFVEKMNDQIKNILETNYTLILNKNDQEQSREISLNELKLLVLNLINKSNSKISGIIKPNVDFSKNQQLGFVYQTETKNYLQLSFDMMKEICEVIRTIISIFLKIDPTVSAMLEAISKIIIFTQTLQYEYFVDQINKTKTIQLQSLKEELELKKNEIVKLQEKLLLVNESTSKQYRTDQYQIQVLQEKLIVLRSEFQEYRNLQEELGNLENSKGIMKQVDEKLKETKELYKQIENSVSERQIGFFNSLKGVVEQHKSSKHGNQTIYQYNTNYYGLEQVLPANQAILSQVTIHHPFLPYLQNLQTIYLTSDNSYKFQLKSLMKYTPLQILERWFKLEAENLSCQQMQKKFSSIEPQNYSEISKDSQDIGHIAEKFIQFLYQLHYPNSQKQHNSSVNFHSDLVSFQVGQILDFLEEILSQDEKLQQNKSIHSYCVFYASILGTNKKIIPHMEDFKMIVELYHSLQKFNQNNPELNQDSLFEWKTNQVHHLNSSISESLQMDEKNIPKQINQFFIKIQSYIKQNSKLIQNFINLIGMLNQRRQNILIKLKKQFKYYPNTQQKQLQSIQDLTREFIKQHAEQEQNLYCQLKIINLIVSNYQKYQKFNINNDGPQPILGQDIWEGLVNSTTDLLGQISRVYPILILKKSFSQVPLLLEYQDINPENEIINNSNESNNDSQTH